jgi:sulfatase modifying factor 1
MLKTLCVLGAVAVASAQIAWETIPDGFQHAAARSMRKPVDLGNENALGNARDEASYVRIPAGSFSMGCVPSDTECHSSENPRHHVTIGHDFWMMRTLATAGAYRRFATATGSAMPEAPSWNQNWAQDDHPIVNVTWFNAAAYCAWARGRLPSEAEWEYAARGGLPAAKYPWGESEPIPTVGASNGANFSNDRETRVGAYRANAFELYDMAGNVWEWCADWYADYSSAENRDPRGPGKGVVRVLRGGSWSNDAWYLRASARHTHTPAMRYFNVGFRCARDASP